MQSADSIILTLSFLVPPVIVGILIVRGEAKQKALLKNAKESLQSGGYLDESYYTRNEPYQRYEGGDYER